jgi:hypothetical protein
LGAASAAAKHFSSRNGSCSSFPAALAEMNLTHRRNDTLLFDLMQKMTADFLISLVAIDGLNDADARRSLLRHATAHIG